MKSSHDVLYVPGLGDNRSGGREILPPLWKLLGINIKYYPSNWRTKETYDQKLRRLLASIDQQNARANDLSLIGTSAGASLALNAFARRTELIKAVVCICGKINHIETINPRTFEQNPAFQDSLEALPGSLSKLSEADRARIMSIHPLYDSTVPVADTLIPGAREKTIPTVGHIASIAYAMTFGAPAIARFIKNTE